MRTTLSRVLAGIISGVLVAGFAMYFGQRSPFKPMPLAPAPIISSPTVNKAFTPSEHIVLQTHIYFTRLGKEPSENFRQRVSDIAASIMSKYEKVTLEYYLDEDGRESAIVTGEKKVWK